MTPLLYSCIGPREQLKSFRLSRYAKTFMLARLRCRDHDGTDGPDPSGRSIDRATQRARCAVICGPGFRRQGLVAVQRRTRDRVLGDRGLGPKGPRSNGEQQFYNAGQGRSAPPRRGYFG